jgi:ankyrin repeat protein
MKEKDSNTIDNQDVDGLFERANRGEKIAADDIIKVKELITHKDPHVLQKIVNAVFHKQLNVVKIFLDEEGIKSFIGKKYGQNNSSILGLAIDSYNYNKDLFKFLLSISPEELLQQVDHNKRTSLHLAAYFHDIDAMSFLIAKVPDLIAKQDKENETFLHHILENEPDNLVDIFRNIFTIDAVRNHQTLFDAKNNKGNTFLQFMLDGLSFSKNKLEVLEFLFSIEEIKGNKELICSKNTGGLFKLIGDGYTILHLAVIGGNLPVLRLLLEKAPLELLSIQDKEGKTAFELKNIAGQTILHVAVMARDSDAIKSILNTDISNLIEAKENQGQTSLDYAVLVGDLDVLKLIFDKSQPDLLCNKDSNGRTSLHHAVKEGKLDIVRFALENAPQELFAIKDNAGKTALDLAPVGSKIHELLLEKVNLINQARNPQQQESSHAGRLAAERNDGQSSGHNR